MSVQIEDFVNPKSMLTPGGATAIVAILSGILFSATGLHVHLLLAIFSLFFAAVVFFSKEFADPTMTKPAKGFFYLVNALIIFAMSTGTHATFDRRPQAAQSTGGVTKESAPRMSSGDRFAGGGFLISSAIAQPADGSVPVLTQDRPLFFDWTKAETGWKLPTTTAKSPIAVSATDKSSAFRRALVEAGLATPTVYVGLEIDKSALPQGVDVRSVQWSFPQSYFDVGKKTTTDSARKFGLAINAWKSFPVLATVELANGETVNFYEFVDLKNVASEKK